MWSEGGWGLGATNIRANEEREGKKGKGGRVRSCRVASEPNRQHLALLTVHLPLLHNEEPDILMRL